MNEKKNLVLNKNFIQLDDIISEDLKNEIDNFLIISAKEHLERLRNYSFSDS